MASSATDTNESPVVLQQVEPQTTSSPEMDLDSAPVQETVLESGSTSGAIVPSVSVPQENSEPVPEVTAIPDNICDVCDGMWDPSSDPNPIPDAHNVIPNKCPACRKKTFGGVGYVVESESIQHIRDVSPEYLQSVGIDEYPLNRLPHVIYRMPDSIQAVPSQAMTDKFYSLFRSGKLLISTFSDKSEQSAKGTNKMREYVLYPEKRRVINEITHEVDGLEAIYPYLDRDMIMMFHFCFDTIELAIKPTADTLEEKVKSSDFLVGMICRTGVQKKFGHTINVRFDILFAKEGAWAKMTSLQRGKVRYLQLLIENTLLVLFRCWNNIRRTDALKARDQENIQNGASPTKPKKLRYYPFCLVRMRDTFKIELQGEISVHTSGYGKQARKYTKIVWYFPRYNLPRGYDPEIHGNVAHATPNSQYGYPVGITSYAGFFSEEELQTIEHQADITDAEAKRGDFDHLPATFQASTRGGKVSRTKFFFGARYLWSKDQMENPDSSLAGGIRADVVSSPPWMKDVGTIMADHLGPKNFYNFYAMNIYHDGNEGLGQHFDDLGRFARPILSLRLFTDCRLTFGAKDFAMTNSTFFVPLPRGCWTVMEANGYATNAIKHCIRPNDMTHKSGVLLIRRIHPQHLREARALYRREFFSKWLNNLEGLEEPETYIDIFVNEEINTVSIKYLTECDLKSLGITKMGPRKIILQAIQELINGGARGPQCHANCDCCVHTHQPEYDHQQQQQQQYAYGQQQQQYAYGQQQQQYAYDKQVPHPEQAQFSQPSSVSVLRGQRTFVQETGRAHSHLVHTLSNSTPPKKRGRKLAKPSKEQKEMSPEKKQRTGKISFQRLSDFPPRKAAPAVQTPTPGVLETYEGKMACTFGNLQAIAKNQQ